MKRSTSAPVLEALGVDTNGASPAEFERQWNRALGCKTNEVALGLLAQVVVLEHLDTATATEEQVDLALARATAMLAELEPHTAAEGMLAAQMVGTHRLAMAFLAQVGFQDQSPQGRDANIQRATRLMRMFLKQLEAMAKLQGRSGQQRVVVEHVTVAAGGQAIVGTITLPAPLVLTRQTPRHTVSSRVDESTAATDARRRVGHGGWKPWNKLLQRLERLPSTPELDVFREAAVKALADALDPEPQRRQALVARRASGYPCARLPPVSKSGDV